jgi:hypothetical protein
MNPCKGPGVRYIYCPHEEDGECLNLVIKKGWSAFNCESCDHYLNSETFKVTQLKAQGEENKIDSRLRGNDDIEAGMTNVNNVKRQVKGWKNV